jgi:hypothetical protein
MEQQKKYAGVVGGIYAGKGKVLSVSHVTERVSINLSIGKFGWLMVRSCLRPEFSMLVQSAGVEISEEDSYHKV